MPEFTLPDFSVIVWVRDRENFEDLSYEILTASSEPPFSSTKYQGMVDFHFGFNDFSDALSLAKTIEPIARHPDVVVLKVQSRVGGAESVTLKDQRETKQNVERNDPCPCGSGKKFKKCCLH